MSKRNFLKGAAILGISGFIVKILGALYRIPLGNMIGDEGMGYYQTAYPLYNLMIAISTAGIPVAIAKLVSEKRAIKDYYGAHKVFKIALYGIFLGGLLTSCTVFITSKFVVTNVIKNPNSYYALIALSPALLFSPLLAAYRGYFQGMQDMTPTALSQIIEQLFRVSVGLFLAIYLLEKGIPLAAGGASFGASAGAMIAFILLTAIYFSRLKKIKSEFKEGIKHYTEDTKIIIKKLLHIAIPIAIGASIVPLTALIDVSIVMKRLQTIGFNEIEANELYGQLTGFAQTLINFPQVFSMALAVSLVPAISSANARNNKYLVNTTIVSGVRVILLIGLPAACGLYALSTPIIKLLYFSVPEAVQLSAGKILQYLSFSVIFLTLLQALTAVLQGIGKQTIPVRNLMIGSSLKLVLTYTLCGVPGIGILGAVIGTIVSYFVASILNIIAIIKYTKVKFGFINILIKPAISVIFMTIAVTQSYNFIGSILDNKIATIIAILIGIIVYGISLLITGTLRYNDFELFPKTEKIGMVLKKIGLLKG